MLKGPSHQLVMLKNVNENGLLINMMLVFDKNFNISVHYHVDWCTKNKCMFRILTLGLFLTCGETSFLLCTHNIKLRAGAYRYLLKRKKESSLTWKGGPLSWW
jgi:hypothetical protein